MLIHLSLRVTPEQLQLFIPEAGITEIKPNQVAYEKGSKSIVDFATNINSLKQHLGEQWESRRRDIELSPIFDFTDLKFDFSIQYLLFITMLAHTSIRKGILVQLFTQAFIDSYEYELWFQDYERIAPEVRQQFEYALQIRSAFFVERLSINGQPKELSSWKRKLESFVRHGLTLHLPMISFFVALYTANTAAETIIVWLAIAFIPPLIIGVLGVALWMLTMRQLLPKDYLRHFVHKASFVIPAKLFAKWLL